MNIDWLKSTQFINQTNKKDIYQRIMSACFNLQYLQIPTVEYLMSFLRGELLRLNTWSRSTEIKVTFVLPVTFEIFWLVFI